MKTSNHKKNQNPTRSQCRHVQDVLLDDLEGQLTAGEHETVSAHLKECSRCASERATLRRTLDLLGRRELPEPDERFWMDLKYRVRQGIRDDRRDAAAVGPPAPVRVWVPAVVTACFIVFLFFWWAGRPGAPVPGTSPLLSNIERQGQRSLKLLGQLHPEMDQDDIVEVDIGLSPSDELVDLLASIPQPALTMERALIGEKMAQDPELWESVIEEETLSETPVELLIEELNEDQLSRLSARLRNEMG
jgi:hypothetical protein